MARGRNSPRTPVPPVEGEVGGDPPRDPVGGEGEEGGDLPSGPARVEGTTSTHVALKPMAKSFFIPIQYSMLSESNYSIWAVKMKIVLRSLGLWSVIEGGDDDEDKDQGATVAISQAVPNNVMMAIAEKQTTKEAWEAIKEMRIGEDRVKKARVQVLKRQLNKLQMEDSETVNDFSIKLTTVVGEIRSLGTTLDDSEVVEKLFSSVPDRFLHIIGTIEQFGDVEKMTVSEAIGRLRTFEEGLKGRGHSKGNGDQLLLTQAEWEAKCAKGKKVDENFSGVKKGGRNGRCRECGRGQGGGQGNKKDDSGDEQEPWKFDVSKVKCCNCNEYGHFAKECPEPNKREKVNQIVNNNDEKPALLLAETCEFAHSTPSTEVMLREEEMMQKSDSTMKFGDKSEIGIQDYCDAVNFEKMRRKIGVLDI